jgi:hypothetical protein
MPKDVATVERAMASDERRIKQLIDQKRLGGRPLEGSASVSWRLWNPAIPTTVLDLHLARGIVVMRGKARNDGRGLVFALGLLGIALDQE